MKKTLFLITLVFSLFSHFIEAQVSEFWIHRFIMDQRYGLHALTIHIEMRDELIEDEEQLLHEVRSFLANYPNKSAYWEAVNKELALYLSKRYPTKPVIRTTISIEPDFTKPCNRKCLCSVNRGEIEQQAFTFYISNQQYRGQLAMISVEIEYDPQASSKDYVNFFAVREAMVSYIKDQASLSISDSEFPERMAEHLHSLFSQVRSFSVAIEIPPHAFCPESCLWKGHSRN